MKNKVLVLGATGFIGRRVVSALTASGWGVPVAGIHRTPESGHSGIETIRVDATDPSSLSAALQGVNAVVNCVAGDADAIARSARALFQSAAKLPSAPLAVHMSSMAVYGSAWGDVSEDAPLKGDLGPYSAAKVEAEAIARGYPRTVILRPGCVYGPESEQWSGRIARWLVARRLGDLGAAGDGWCNLVHIDDVVAAILSSLRQPDAAGGAFNLVMPSPPTWNEYLVRYAQALHAVPVRRISPRQLEIESRILAAPLKAAEIAVRKLGQARRIHVPPPIPPSLLALARQEIRLLPGRAQRALGWTCKGLDEGLAESAAWFVRTAGSGRGQAR